MKRTNVFLEETDLHRLKQIAAQNEQSLAWLMRKVMSSYVRYVDDKQLRTDSVAAVNATVGSFGNQFDPSSWRSEKWDVLP